MVLGLINFLLGGKKQKKTSKSAQVSSPLNKVGGESIPTQTPAVPNGQDVATENAESDLKFKDLNKKEESSVKSEQNSASPQKKTMSSVITKIHEELKSTNDRLGEMVSDIKSIENNVTSLGHRLDSIENSKKISDEKMSEMDSSMSKFLSLYELINNQYNPFVENDKLPQKIEISSDGNTIPNSLGAEGAPASFDDLNLKPAFNIPNINHNNINNDELETTLLGLDTLNIEEAAGDAVPLMNLKNNTNSLVIILSWLEHLIKRVGVEETRNSLRYYAEVLRWISPEVFFDLDKYLRGMKDRKNIEEDAKLTVKDHIVSLYFISKLNEKTLDEKLTKAVLQIIKQ